MYVWMNVYVETNWSVVPIDFSIIYCKYFIFFDYIIFDHPFITLKLDEYGFYVARSSHFNPKLYEYYDEFA